MRSTYLLSAALPIAAVAITIAQDIHGGDRLLPVRTDVDLVLDPVTVTDQSGTAMSGLDRKHFTVLQDKVPQNILAFSQRNLPCSVGVIADTSGSMYHQLGALKSAVRAFLETAEPRDEASL